jgi:hypothetical protein
MDSSSRRAFGLDSRTVWVEQQLVRDVLMPRDNLPLGPGEYHSKIPERHISTPKLGKFRGAADHFLSFKSDLQIATPSNKSNGPYSIRNDEDLAQSFLQKSPSNRGDLVRSEFSTIFHDHDVRQPLDPSKRFCDTPGSYLSHDPLLRSVAHDGVKNTSRIHFGPDDIPFGERNEYRTALPEYEVKYDSKHIKPVAPLGSFSRNKRVIKIGTTSYCDQHEVPVARSPKRGGLSEQMSVYELRCSLVPLPKLKTRRPEQLSFDASSYRTAKTKEPLDLHPTAINRVASVHLFDGLVSIPRKHVSVGFTSPSKNKTT